MKSAGPNLVLERRRQAVLLTLRNLVDETRERYRELERNSGAPIAAHRALAHIAASPGITASDLAQELGMRRPAMSQVLKILAERAWIRRHRPQQDQRTVCLEVTAAGEALVRATSGRVVGALRRSVSALSNRELLAAQVGLGALLRHLLPDDLKGVLTRRRALRLSSGRTWPRGTSAVGKHSASPSAR
ncbi:MAG TPA: MarR family transcriptional regulator [Steroidobacteraceae bacterium]